MKKIQPIIWLDDDQKFMDDAEGLFSLYGFAIIKCITVAQALQAINNELSNFLLLDVNFPGNQKEGMVFLEAIRKSHPDLKVVVFTAYSDSDDAVTAIRDHFALDYLKKPVFMNTKEEAAFFLKLSGYYQMILPVKSEKKKWWQIKEYQIALIGALAVIVAAIIPVIYHKNTAQKKPVTNFEKASKDSSKNISSDTLKSK